MLLAQAFVILKLLDMKKSVLVCVAVWAFLLAAAIPAVAQISTLSVARNLLIADSPLREGDIISITRRGYIRARLAYDPAIVGVIAGNPAITLTVKEATAEAARKRRVVESGEALVRVSTVNGPIRGGDPVTSSPQPGVGMKATRSGYAVGTALANYTESDTTKIGLIPVATQIRYYAASGGNVPGALRDIFNISLLASYEQPLVVFRYLIAAIIIIASFLIGFFYFGRIAKAGLDALGRNPLAGRMIEVGIFINVFLALVVIAAGFLLAFLVLRL